PRPRDGVPEAGDRAKRPVPGERSQRKDHAETGEGAQLPLEEREATIPFLGGRAVPRWGAPVHGAEVGPAEPEAVVHGGGGRPVREPGPMHRCEQEVPRTIAREDPPRPVPAVSGRRKPEHEDARPRVPEARHRSPPIPLIREARDLLPSDPLAPGNEPRAPTAHHD